MQKILVTGGAGYIGSHTLVELIQKGYEVISIDNLSNNDGSLYLGIEKITGQKVDQHAIDLRDKNALQKLFKKHSNITGIIHFAAFLDVKESVEKPLEYLDNNVGGLIHLLQATEALSALETFVFSSSCTVYGNPKQMPVTEDMPIQAPMSPYGHTKQLCESILKEYLPSKDIKGILLRYFNPAGAHPSGLIGENPKQLSNHLIPILSHVAKGVRKEIQVFGSDYDTRDGTCIRDYIHVSDLAKAHVLALESGFLSKVRSTDIYNLGLGRGVSVLEAIQAFEKANNIEIPYRIENRRPGDIPAIYANCEKAKRELGWQASLSLEDIMETAWLWETQRTNM